MKVFLQRNTAIMLSALRLLISFVNTSAQKRSTGHITGTLIDTSSKEALAEASVSIIALIDSSLLTMTLSDNKGVFYVRGVASGNYRLIITFQGYYSFEKFLAISSKVPSINLGHINMVHKIINLGEVIVEPQPVEVKKDTTEFRASAFKTVPDATAEDLLKKLPGIAVANDGSIKANGEEVQKIYVDGKEFFSNDPKMATRNITADMIESVQVYNDVSEQAKFTRMDDGSRSKTINIKLKKNRQKGIFGKALAGYGTDNRFQAGLNYNSFSNNQRISVITGTNNLNDQDFNANDKPVTATGVPGINTTSQYGVNYVNSLADRLKCIGKLSSPGQQEPERQKRRVTIFSYAGFFH